MRRGPAPASAETSLALGPDQELTTATRQAARTTTKATASPTPTIERPLTTDASQTSSRSSFSIEFDIALGALQRTCQIERDARQPVPRLSRGA